MSVSEKKNPSSGSDTLPEPPSQFFMSLRDIAFWLRSAKTESRLTQLQRKHGVKKAFDLLYRQSNDPWGHIVPHFRYQRLKYEKLLAMLPDRRYRAVLDMGCGLGVFTRMLAPHADQVLGVEHSAVAVEQASRLSVDVSNVSFMQGDVLQMKDLSGAVAGPFDLIVFVDVLYYLPSLSDDVLKAIANSAASSLSPDGVLLVANHFFFDLDAQSRMVRQIHSAFRWATPFRLVREQRHPFFLASLMMKRF